MDSTLGEHDSYTTREVSRAFKKGEMIKDEALKLALDMEGAKNLSCSIPIYTSQPQRTWVGLTEDEATALWEITDTEDSWELIKRVEAKLKELNI